MKHKNPHSDLHRAVRAAAREATVAALKDGRKTRASTFKDRRAEASRRACRGKVSE